MPSRPRRLAYVIDELEVGGTQRQLLEMATGLVARAWSVRVLCLQPVLTMAPDFRAAGIPVDIVDKRGTLDVALVARLARILRHDGTDIVHAFSATAEFFGGLAARLAGARFVASVRGFDERLPPLVERGKRLACRLAAVVVANSAAGGAVAVRRGIVPPTKLRVIPNGIRSAAFLSAPVADGAAARSGVDACRVLSVGRLVRVKRYDLLVSIAAHIASSHPRVRFLIAGDGPLRGGLERQIRDSGLEGVVELLGERRDVADLLRAADVYLVTSCSEGLSNSLMEAMAAGLPVVASAVGGNPELVLDGGTGYLFPAGAAATAAHWLGALISSPQLRRRFGEAARDRIAREFDARRMLDRLEDVYAELG
jgi:glycosyltransferase involved in cell wall biosynthesis